MRADLATVIWKEWRSVLAGRARRQILIVGGMLAFWAVLFPIQIGTDWLSDPVPPALLGVTMPIVIVGITVPEAIAGERERHTLRTLLASRLSDRAILFGKLAFAVTVGWLASPLILLIGLVSVNVTAGSGSLLFYDLTNLAIVLLVGLLLALLTGGVGIFVSLRARTAQEAQQLTVFALMLPFMGLTAVALLLVDNPAFRSFVDWLGSGDALPVGLAVLALLVLVDGLVLLAADRRFRRARLMER
jgi:ABC-2 type transport system permease protein